MSRTRLLTALAVTSWFALFTGRASAGPTTAIRSWTPPGTNVTLRHATVCHDVTRDVYVIGAVFRATGGAPYYITAESLWMSRVQGNSALSGYGELIGSPTLLKSESRIDNFDCAADDANNVFLYPSGVTRGCAIRRSMAAATTSSC